MYGLILNWKELVTLVWPRTRVPLALKEIWRKSLTSIEWEISACPSILRFPSTVCKKKLLEQLSCNIATGENNSAYWIIIILKSSLTITIPILNSVQQESTWRSLQNHSQTRSVFYTPESSPQFIWDIHHTTSFKIIVAITTIACPVIILLNRLVIIYSSEDDRERNWKRIQTSCYPAWPHHIGHRHRSR